MSKKISKPKYSVDPFPEVSTVDQVLTVDGIDLPRTIAEILKRYNDAFLQSGFMQDQSFQLTLQLAKYYLGV
jgi:hypothetical protein